MQGARILLIFVDGLGLGVSDPAINPVVRAATPVLRALLGGPLAGSEARATASATLVPLDACLGVPGLPQSATGQVALLTGRNAPAHIGRHLVAYPSPSLAALLESHGLFGVLRRRDVRVALANAYTPAYFEAVAARRLRHGAMTLHALQAGVALRTVDDLAAGRAVYQDLTNARARELGADVPVIPAEQAGRRLARVSRDHAFTVFEFFQTDLAGHGRHGDPVEVIERLDRFLGGVIDGVDLGRTLVLLTSDHGNIEDARSRAHTTNPVPALLVGTAREPLRRRLHAITDVAPACLDLLAHPVNSPDGCEFTGTPSRPTGPCPDTFVVDAAEDAPRLMASQTPAASIPSTGTFAP